MTIEELIKDLKNLIKEYPETKQYPIRAIENSDWIQEPYGDIGDPKPNHWLVEVEVSFKGQSGYEQSGEVRLIGGE